MTANPPARTAVKDEKTDSARQAIGRLSRRVCRLMKPIPPAANPRSRGNNPQARGVFQSLLIRLTSALSRQPEICITRTRPVRTRPVHHPFMYVILQKPTPDQGV